MPRSPADTKTDDAKALPELLTPDDVGQWLRTSRKAVYLMAERGQLPPPIRVGRRLLWDGAELKVWLNALRDKR